jgi:5-methylcytosine-specific restriction protein A
MPVKPGRPCRSYPCSNITNDSSGYCDIHKKQVAKQYDQQRGNSTERGYGAQWQRIRSMFLSMHPLCESCLDSVPQRIKAASDVHHIDGNVHNMVQDNLKALCHECHSKISAFGHQFKVRDNT